MSVMSTRMGGRVKASTAGRIAAAVMATCLLGTLTLSDARADAPPGSQQIGTLNPIVDEWGTPLRGTDPWSWYWGIDVVEGDVVQVILALDGVIHDPEIDGTPHPRDIVLANSRIGLGVSPLLPNSGLFSCSLSPRPSHGSKLYVRAFNASSLEEATHYGNSQLFSVSTIEFQTFWVDIESTDRLLDPDGLGSLGNPPGGETEIDTDMDGVSNDDEIAAGTNPYGAWSFLGVERMTRVGGATVLEWSSVPGRTYVVEKCGADGQEFTAVGSVVATGDVTPMSLANAMTDDSGFFRIRVVTN